MDTGHPFNAGGDLNSTPSPSNLPSRNKLVIPESLRVLTDPRYNIPALSTAIASGLKLPQLSPDTTERVFPIRSVVSREFRVADIAYLGCILVLFRWGEQVTQSVKKHMGRRQPGSTDGLLPIESDR